MSSTLKFFVSASDFMRCAIPPHGGSRVQQFGRSIAAANLWSVCGRLIYLGGVPNPVNYACALTPVHRYLAQPPIIEKLLYVLHRLMNGRVFVNNLYGALKTQEDVVYNQVA